MRGVCCGVIALGLFALGVSTAACASARPAWSADELARLDNGSKVMPIVKYDPSTPAEQSVLRQQALRVDPADPELLVLLERMNATLADAGGVGLAAPQVGLSRQVILVRHGTRPTGQPTRVQPYLNPSVDWVSAELDDDYEACLSIDGLGGLVRRPQRIRLSFDPVGGGPRQSIDVRDWDARIVQHEVDHLHGMLFVDKLVGPLMPPDEMRKLRDAGHRKRGWLPAP